MGEEEKRHTRKRISVKVIAGLLIGICLIIAVLLATYFYMQYQKAQRLLQNPTVAAQLEAQDLVSKVGKLIDLPTGEQPTIATVSDYRKLQDEPFFAHAVNGDKVLIYTKAKEAILYNPTSNKIIAVAPINIGNDQQLQTTTSITPKPTYVIPHITTSFSPTALPTQGK